MGQNGRPEVADPQPADWPVKLFVRQKGRAMVLLLLLLAWAGVAEAAPLTVHIIPHTHDGSSPRCLNQWLACSPLPTHASRHGKHAVPPAVGTNSTALQGCKRDVFCSRPVGADCGSLGLKTVDEYFLGANQSIQNAGVQYILDNVSNTHTAHSSSPLLC